jgi:preprotein translocase subunit SecD
MKNRNLLWRGLLILAVTLICVALAYPPKKKINLGLDLQGGMHLVLQVHTEDALRAETDSDMARLLDQAKEQGARATWPGSRSPAGRARASRTA